MTSIEERFTASSGRLKGLAYRMLGSRADAEDVVQDAYLRLRKADSREIRNVEAFLMTTVTRLCLDVLKSARAQREVYVGPWLPEPVLDAESLSPGAATEIADDLSFALLLVLEKLTAPERAAFLLHDVFDTPYARIAESLGKSEAACRQLAARARKAVRSAKTAGPVAPEAHAALLAKFAEAVATGDASGIESLLTADAVVYSDGGGVKIAALNPILGANRVARFFSGIVRKHRAQGGTSRFEAAEINGSPGLLCYIDGALDQTISIDIDGDRVAAIYMVRNPHKLTAVGGMSETAH